ENELQAKIEQHEKHIQNLELGHERALKELTQEFEKRFNLWKIQRQSKRRLSVNKECFFN
ncbi:hypothetical protein, partial [Campylobacter coli]|uniref:hypothetical protein n=1 Tax=Campylobacter coli TaxID=195 RepID=UPI0040336C0D